MKYARKCDYTGKGMNTGYVFCDVSLMIDDRELFIKEIRKDRDAILNLLPKDIQDIYRFDNSCYLNDKELEQLSNKIANALNNTETDEELCDIAYAVDYYYWTEWEDEYEWEEVDGILTEIE